MQTRQSLSFSQIVNMLAVGGHKHARMIVGHMGSGKSSILKALAEKKPDHKIVYVDCTQLDIGDFKMPVVDHKKGTYSFLPNTDIYPGPDVPVIIMFDEFGKAPRPVQNAVLPIMLEKRVGAAQLHPDSIIFSTTNLGSEGVGDNEQPHSRNRREEIFMRKPTASEWVSWGRQNGVHHTILGFVNDNPAVMASFEDHANPDDNPYIYHPKSSRRSFCTPRSLAMASHVMEDNETLNDDEIMMAGLTGLLGERAAADMVAYASLSRDLPRHQEIIEAPETCRLPSGSGAAAAMIVDRSILRTDKDTIAPLVTYIKRLPKELQALYATEVFRNRNTTMLCLSYTPMKEWIKENSWMTMPG